MGGQVRLHRNMVPAQEIGSGIHRHGRNHGVEVAMDQLHRRPRADQRLEQLGRGDGARIADDAGDRPLAGQAHMQRQHGALGEAEQRQVGLGQAGLLQQAVEEMIQDRHGIGQPGLALGDREIADRPPLVADLIAVLHARHPVRPVGRIERGVRKRHAPAQRQPVEILAAGAEAVAQHDDLPRTSAGEGRQGGTGQFRQVGHGASLKSLRLEALIPGWPTP